MPDQSVESVANALRLMEALSDGPVLRVATAAKRLGVAPSTAHRLLRTMADHGFLAQDENRAYRAGPALRQLGRVVHDEDEVEAAALPFVKALNAQFGMAVHVGILRGPNVVYLAGCGAAKKRDGFNRVGRVFPAHASSIGKSLLATIGQDALLEWFPSPALRRFTRNTIVTRRALLEELQLVAQRGYATNFSESERGLAAVSCAIRDRAGNVRGALSLAATEGRFRRLELATIAEALTAACAAAGQSFR